MKVKYSLAGAGAVLLILFALQNMATVELNVLIWSFHTRRFVLILFAVLVGMLIGWALSGRKRLRENSEGDKS